MKLCKDCINAELTYNKEKAEMDYFCTVKGTLNLVDGSPYPAHTIRYDERQCGILGRWWAAKPKEPHVD